MKRTVCIVVCVAAMAVAGQAAAQFVSPFHIVPVIAKAEGDNNTQWLSDLSMSNLSTFAVDVRAGFFREGTSGRATDLDPDVVTTLQPGETRVVTDVLGTWFPGEGETKGTLLIIGEPQGSGDEDDVKLSVGSRTYNVGDPKGTFGQGVNPSLLAWVFGRGASVLTGVRQNGDFRTNVGIVNLSYNILNPNAKTTFIVTTYNAAGAMVSEKKVEVEALSMRQFSLSSLGVSDLAFGRTEVVVDPSTITWDSCSTVITPGLTSGLFFTYMSKVDQGTGDGEFSLGQVDWAEYEDECGEEPTAAICP